MIDKTEITDFAKALSLTAEVVEKDYVLGWVLAGINNTASIESKWIFKGGTCLKKCYFETYRFSEDLDFTLSDETHINENFLAQCFSEMADWVYDNTGIQVLKNLTKFDIHPDPKKKYVEGKIRYIGPLGERRGGHAKILLDLTANELLARPSEKQQVFHPYSDQPSQGILARCYSFEEVFAEKARALAERTRPRDLYDVVHLFRRKAPVNKSVLLNTFRKKCEFKGIDLPTVASIQKNPKYEELHSQWDSMLRHQLSALPPIESFLKDMGHFFEWLYEESEGSNLKQISDDQEDATETAPIFVDAPRNIDHSWRLPDRLIRPSADDFKLEKIRFSAANHLLLEIVYIKKLALRLSTSLNLMQ